MERNRQRCTIFWRLMPNDARDRFHHLDPHANP
jgi:hypothetical protein